MGQVDRSQITRWGALLDDEREAAELYSRLALAETGERRQIFEEHVERLAAYWAEVMGGPPRYSQSCGDHSAMLYMDSGQGDMTELGRRFIDCFVRAADDAGLPEDPEFRAVLRSYMRWAVDEVLSYPSRDADVPTGLPMPRWSWDGLQQRAC